MSGNSTNARPCDRCGRKAAGARYPLPDGKKVCKRCKRGTHKIVLKKRKERFT